MSKNLDSTLKTGKYTIRISAGSVGIYALDEAGNEKWLAAAADVDIATNIVEGLILVETKRFYYPQSGPDIKPNVEKTTLPFLKKGISL